MSEAKAQAAAAKARALPSKEGALFKELLSQYEMKQHKKGVKVADQILKKFPNHGETLAIKALIIHSSLPYNHPTASSVPKAAEAQSLIAAALRKDPYSHITHHVQAIILRADKDFSGANLALSRARAIDSENIPLIRDSISLSTQLGRHRESLEARHKYFTMRPMLRTNWITLAVGHELCGDFEEALRVLEGLDDVTKDEGLPPVEKTQLSWHTIRIMAKAGKRAEALELLEDNMRDRIIPSSGETLETQARLLVELDQREKAEEVYRKLLEANPDCLGYYQLLFRCKGLDLDGDLSEEQMSKVLVMLDGFAESYPRAAAPKRLALEVAAGDEFRVRAEKYLMRGLEKGIPSLFVDVKGLYVKTEKLTAVEEILTNWQGKLEADEPLTEHEEETPEPTVLLWLYYYLALHHSHYSHPSPNYAKSLTLLGKAQAHTPTLPEIHMARARVLKRAGDPEGAAREMEAARALDLQDRFLNGKSGKYLLRTGEVETATKVLGLFTKKDAPSPGQDLRDMQCNWFLLEEGNAHARAGRLGPAVKRYEQVISVFHDMEDDAYDFHSYSIRKMTLNAYLDMVAFEDKLQTFPDYIQAAVSVAKIYLAIHDDPSLKENQLTPEQEAERRKAQQKARKADSKAKKAAPPPADGKKDEPTLPDADPEGAVYLKGCEPLAAIEKILAPLYGMAVSRIELWLLASEVAVRQKRYSQAMRAISAAQAIDPTDLRIHLQIIQLALASPTDPAVRAELSSLVPEGTSAEKLNADFLQVHPASALRVLEGAKALRKILQHQDGQEWTKRRGEVESLLEQMYALEVSPDLETYRAAVAFMKSELGSADAVVAKFSAALKERLPLAMIFATPAETHERKAAWAKEDAAKVSEVDGGD